VRVRGARRRPQPRLPHRSGAGLPCDRGPRRLPELLARGSGCAWFQTLDPPADDVLDSSSEDDKAGDSFVPKIRTARCVASQVVPRSRTMPRSSSAPMAAARCRGDLSEVTVVVAQTRMYMAARVSATMSMVVTIEARIFFIRLGCDSDTANQRIAQTNSQLSLLAGRLSHLRTNSDSWRVPVRVKSRQQQQKPPRPEAPPTEPTSTQAAAHNPQPLTTFGKHATALVLTHPIDSKTMRRGDTIFAETTAPVLAEDLMVIPSEAFVQSKVGKNTLVGSGVGTAIGAAAHTTQTTTFAGMTMTSET